MIKKMKALTLTETVVYIAIFSIFMLILIQFFLSVQINQDKVYKELELEMNQIFLTNHFEEMLGETYAFSGDSNNVIFENNQGIVEYKIVDGKLMLLRGLESVNLLNTKVVIQSLSVEEIYYVTGSTSAVRINISLMHRGNERITRDFSNLIKVVQYED